MKLSTRVKISFIFLSLIPLFLIVLIVSGLGMINRNTMEERFGISKDIGMDSLYDPFKLMGNLTTREMEEIDETILHDPNKMEDITYLTDIDNKLGAQNSFIIVKKGDEIIFWGKLAEEYRDMVQSELFNINMTDANMYIMNNGQFHLRIRSFLCADGSFGEAFIVTDITELIKSSRSAMIQTFVVVILMFLAVGGLILFYLYRSIIKPVNSLKKAAVEIKEGNLDFSIEAEGDDEIGELCVNFEEMRQKLKEQVDITMQFEKDNRELISNISHDLKTPITAIKGYVEGIMDGVADTPEKQERYLKTIYTKANDMQRLIEELSLYSKLDSKTMVYAFQKVNVHDYFEDCIDEIRMDMESRGIGLGFFNYVDPKVIIIADPEQLKRVILNIVNNAAKYMDNPSGIVNIRIHDEPEFIQVEIEDNGKGIAPEELTHIFERGYRTDSSRNSMKGGSGFGLSICKKIIEEHGGRIWATSKVSVGTSICFVLRKYEENRIYE